MVLTVLGTPATAADLGGSRYAGADRYETAAQQAGVFDQTVRDPSIQRNFVVASGENYPDALAANFLAGNLGARLILTRNLEAPKPSLDLVRLYAGQTNDRVIVVSGASSVSDRALNQFANVFTGYTCNPNDCANPTVSRIAAADAYSLAATIATSSGTVVGTFGSNGRTAIIASGERFPDALAASPLVYQQKLPLLYTRQASLPAPTANALMSLKVDSILLMGGSSAISTGVESNLKALGFQVRRVAGPDRQSTAVALSNLVYSTLNWPADETVLARGDNYPDAIVSGQLAGRALSPILLTQSPTVLSRTTKDYLVAKSSSLCGRVNFLGGTAAISNSVAGEAQSASRVNACSG